MEMQMIKKLMIISCITFCCAIKPVVLVEIVNNSVAGIKATYQLHPTNIKKETFIESKQSFTTPELSLASPNVLINTYKGPLTLTLTINNESIEIPGNLQVSRRFNPFERNLGRERIPNSDIKAELSAEYPVAQAHFTSGRPWDEYTIRVTVDEKQLENSKVSIFYKPLERPKGVLPAPLTRPAPAQRREGPEESRPRPVQLTPVTRPAPAQPRRAAGEWVNIGNGTVMNDEGFMRDM